MVSLRDVSIRVKSTDIDYPEKLKNLIIYFCDFMANYDCKVNAFADSAKPLKQYKTLPIEEQKGIFYNFLNYCEVLTSAEKEGIKIRKDSPATAWWAFKQMGYVPRSDLLNHIKDNDIIEFYDINEIQIFRTINMFQFLSYSLDEVFSYKWSDLYERDKKRTEEIQDFVDQVISNKIKNTITTHIPTHIVQEKFSPMRNAVIMRQKVISPLFNSDNKLAGFAFVSEVVPASH